MSKFPDIFIQRGPSPLYSSCHLISVIYLVFGETMTVISVNLIYLVNMSNFMCICCYILINDLLYIKITYMHHRDVLLESKNLSLSQIMTLSGFPESLSLEISCGNLSPIACQWKLLIITSLSYPENYRLQLRS